MLFSSWLRNGNDSAPAHRLRRRTPPSQQVHLRPQLESLEDRCLFSVLTVTNLQDSGAGSLRAEIAAAQSGDTIVFASTLTSSATLLSPAALVSSFTKPTISNGKGHGKPTPPPPPPPPTPTITLTSGELDLTKNLTIQGPGAAQLAIRGAAAGGNERAFEVDPTATVTLSGLTISGTTGYYDYAGAILNDGTLTVSGCTVSGYTAGGEGGGIFNVGTLFLNDSTVTGCWADGGSTKGGGISNWGTATLNNTVISNNQAEPDASLSYPWFNQGGGIFNSGKMTLNSCSVTGNLVRTAGGGIFNSGTLILDATAVYNNGNSPYGGDIYNAGALTLQNASSVGNVDYVGTDLTVLDTSTIGYLYSDPAWLSFSE